ncbi:hypothetical protein DPEC_G00052480 [Dallia pectoralis]|uniref:Uncharacterized protein n=1 Tax=Dallia pectoralis TaxID=75939 RepID=A0ACC2HCA3_DALPE|nr:hypothetical protein DPEC_G00052480 [Dallia pectoralis]
MPHRERSSLKDSVPVLLLSARRKELSSSVLLVFSSILVFLRVPFSPCGSSSFQAWSIGIRSDYTVTTTSSPIQWRRHGDDQHPRRNPFQSSETFSECG